MRTLQVVNNQDGRLEVFGTRGPFHMWQDPTSATDWSNWSNFPSLNATELVVGRNQDGRLEVFAIDPPGTVFHMWQIAPNSGWTPGWQSLGGGHHMTQIEVAQNANGRLEVFAIDTFGTVFHMIQSSPGIWPAGEAWQTLGGGHSIKQIVAGQNQDGRLEVYVLPSDTSGSLLHMVQTLPGVWPNTSWGTMGSGYQIEQIVVGRNGDGRLEVFGTTNGAVVVHMWQTPAGVWPANYNWQPLGGPPMGQIAVVENLDGRLEVFGVERDAGTVDHIWQLRGGGWSNWSQLSNPETWGVIAVGVNQDGRLEAFDIKNHPNDPGASLDHCWELAPDGLWGQWQPLTT